MTEYAFPRDLLEGIKARWQCVPDQQFELPDDRILQRLLETCYHASFRTSEQRAVRCVVAYAPVAGIPDGALRLANGPVVLTDTELVRLSPITQRRQTVIGCDQKDGWLCIWGFFEYGHAWVQHSAGDPPAVPIQPADFPPDCLTITIEGPGALTVSRGRTGLVRLRDGRVIFPQENLFQTMQNPLGRFFHQLIADLQASAEFRGRSNFADEIAGRRSFLDVYTTSILAILERIRLRQHGGSIVIVRVPLDEQLAHTTYTVSDHAGLAGEIMAYKALDDLLRAPHSPSDAAAELERSRAKLALGRTSRKLIRGISQISLLAAVDGAVLLDDHLRIQGFGVRFPVLLPPGTTVLDALTGSEYFCDQWGLRHQSVFSVCQKCEQAIGLVVSQDGDVKAVKAVDGRLMFWDGILD
jgi:Probable sensor domain DACNV